MPSNTQHKDYLLITNIHTQTQNQNAEAEFDLKSQTWRLPYTIDDSDLTFDGKQLNMLYEENRWQAERPVFYTREGKDKSSVSERKFVV